MSQSAMVPVRFIRRASDSISVALLIGQIQMCNGAYNRQKVHTWDLHQSHFQQCLVQPVDPVCGFSTHTYMHVHIHLCNLDCRTLPVT